jgi:cytoskeleton protein RodZ
VHTQIGPTLREARIRRKVDLSDVEQTTKIRVRYLRALENEEWDVLPGTAYARSFIRAYANYLGLDGERLADDFRRQQEEAGGEVYPRPEPAGVPARAPRGGGPGWRPPTAITAALISLGLIAALLLIGGLTGGSDESGGSGDRQEAKRRAQREQAQQRKQQQPGTVALDLTASGDVWTCVLDANGDHVVNGEILTAGVEAGPFRSGNFQVAFGNGAVSMRVNGKEVDVPDSASPLGFEVTPERVIPLSEGNRPDCA